MNDETKVEVKKRKKRKPRETKAGKLAKVLTGPQIASAVKELCGAYHVMGKMGIVIPPIGFTNAVLKLHA